MILYKAETMRHDDDTLKDNKKSRSAPCTHMCKGRGKGREGKDDRNTKRRGDGAFCSTKGQGRICHQKC